MFPEDFLSVSRIDCTSDATSKKSALQQLSLLLASTSSELSTQEIFDRLYQRERISPTALGHGIGLPHARVAGVDEPRGALLILREGIDFDAIDREPVDLVFGLIVPEQAETRHLEILAALASLFSQEAIRNRLRICTKPDKIIEEITEWAATYKPLA